MEIRRSYDRLVSTMGFPILVRWHLYIESGPWWLRNTRLCSGPFFSHGSTLIITWLWVEFHPASLSEGWPVATKVTCPITSSYTEGILPKGPYLPCISMAGRAFLAGYHQHKKHKSSFLEEGQPVLSNRDLVWYEPILGLCLLYIIIISHFGHCGQLVLLIIPHAKGRKRPYRSWQH